MSQPTNHKPFGVLNMGEEDAKALQDRLSRQASDTGILFECHSSGDDLLRLSSFMELHFPEHMEANQGRKIADIAMDLLGRIVDPENSPAIERGQVGDGRPHHQIVINDPNGGKIRR